jgi:hypothetical protein
MPAKVKYPPLVRWKTLRGTVPLSVIRKAVRKVVDMEKKRNNDQRPVHHALPIQHRHSLH